MKKFLCLILTAVLLCASLSGCLSASGSGFGDTSIPETVIYDKNDIRITVTGLEDSRYELQLKLLIENDSDKDILVRCDMLSVNGISINTYLYTAVAAGKKVNDYISLDEYEMVSFGIEQIVTVTGRDLFIYDDDSYSTEDYSYEVLDTIDFTLENSNGGDYVQVIDESGEILFQENGVTIIVQKYNKSLFGPTVSLLIKNESGENINAYLQQISVNDYMVYGWLDEYICDQSVRFCELELDSSDLKENGIEKVEKIAFTVEFMDLQTYDTIWETEELEYIITE